jgi:heat shock protein HtpX
MYHIRNYDIRAMMIAAVMVGVIMLLSDLLLRTFYGEAKEITGRRGKYYNNIYCNRTCTCNSFSNNRSVDSAGYKQKREFSADAGGSTLTRYPQGLANALKKIRDDPDPLVDTANRATAHLYISTPFRKKGGWLKNLFSTHPPIDERIRRLEAM